jgi:hypothetical protein
MNKSLKMNQMIKTSLLIPVAQLGEAGFSQNEVLRRRTPDRDVGLGNDAPWMATWYISFC